MSKSKDDLRALLACRPDSHRWILSFSLTMKFRTSFCTGNVREVLIEIGDGMEMVIMRKHYIASREVVK